MKIIIKDSDQKPLFTFDVGKGTAEIGTDVEMDDVALSFIKGIETVLLGSKNRFDRKWRDVILEFGGGENCGDLIFGTGSGGEDGRGGDISIVTPDDVTVAAEDGS